MRFLLCLALLTLAFHPPALAAKKKAEKAYNLGVKAGNDGDLDAAIKRFAAAVRIDGKYAQAWRDLGKALLYKDRVPEAVAALKKAATIKKKSYPSNLALGQAYLQLNLPKLALGPLRVSLKAAKKKDKPKVLLSLGAALSDAGEHEEAVKTLASLAKKSPTDAKLLMKLALAQFRGKKSSDAIITLDKVVALEPSQKRAHLLKAKVYEGDNKLEQAAAAYGAACDLGDQKACLKSR
mgnify:CR=1 FL=1